MALPRLEDFAGASATLNSGLGWLQVMGAVSRDGSGRGSGAGGDNFVADSSNTYSNDQYSQLVFIGGVSPEPQVRGSGTSGGGTASCYFMYAGGGSIGIGKYVNTSFTDKGSVVSSLTANDLYRLEASGTGLTLKKNGTNVTTATDASLTSGAPGPGMDTTTVDNWEGGNLGASSITGTASGSFALTGAAQDTVLIQAAASGLFSISGSATGVVGTAPISGVAGGVFGLTGTATATSLVQGVATGTFALAGSAAATALVQGAASGTFALSGSAQGIVGALAEILGAAAGAFALSGAAQGRTMPDVGGGSSRKKRRGGLLFEQAALEKLEQMENSAERAATAPAREGVRKASTPRVIEVSVAPMVTADDREEEELVLALFVERFF